jgi:hypothetical protein
MVVADRAPVKYLFFQQLNDMCTIAPMLNRYRLQELKEIGQNYIEQAFDNPELALTRQQWFGEGHQYFFTWRKFLTDFMYSQEGVQYLSEAEQNGLVAPNFYDNNGINIFDKDRLAFITYPYFFADLSSESIVEEMDASFVIPIVSPFRFLHDRSAPPERVCLSIKDTTEEESGWLIYSKETKRFEDFSYSKFKNDPIFSSIKSSVMSRGAQFQEPINFSYGYGPNWPKTTIGFKSFIYPHWNWSRGFGGGVNNQGKMPYCLGFLKTMFLVLGIDNNNQAIHDNDLLHEYQVHAKMRELIQADRNNNPWSDKFFKKEYFIQYALAEIFKANKNLYDDAVKTVDITGKRFWQIYDDIVSGRLILYKDNRGTQYSLDEIKKYLPGKHQALAYFFTEALRILWYGAASKDAVALYNALGMYDPEHPILSRLNAWRMGLNFSKIKNNAEKQVDGISFLSVWFEIKRALQKRCSGIQDWVSFDSHGWVISFDQALISMQQQVARQNGCDYQFLDKLGVAGIESWWGHELETFYKK